MKLRTISVLSAALICFATCIVVADSNPKSKTTYARSKKPVVFPEHKLRRFKPYTWADFGNRMMFTASPGVARQFRQKGPRYFVSFNIGKTGRVPEIAGANPQRGPSLKEARMMQKRTPRDMLYQGGQTGESDATFAHLAKDWYATELPRTQLGQYQDLLYFAENLSQRSYGYIAYGHNLWAHHYMAKNLPISISKAQIFYRNTFNPMVHFTMLRGAARQNGLSYWTQYSGVIDRKTDRYRQKHRRIYEKLLAKSKRQELTAREKHKLMTSRRKSLENTNAHGNSYSATRRMLYYAWLSGCRAFKYEIGTVYRGSDKLTPAGLSMKHISLLQNKSGHPGEMQTPIALMMDFYQGWRPAEIRGPKNKPERARMLLNSWVSLDYKRSDWQISSLLDFFYNGWMNNARYPKTEKYLMPVTPFGDSVDTITSDAAAGVLNRYGLIIWAGQNPTNPMRAGDKLLEFANRGKTVLLFAEAASKMFPEYKIGKRVFEIKPGAKVKLKTGKTISENNSFELYSIKKNKSMKTLATCNSKPAAVSVKCKNGGKIIIVLSKDAFPKNYKGPNWPTPGPTILSTDLLKLAQGFVAQYARKQQLITAGKNLSTVVCQKKPGVYTVGIFNDDIKPAKFKIKSHIGKIRSIKEVKLDYGPSQKHSAWLPEKYRNGKIKSAAPDKSHIGGKDLRIFIVKVAQKPKNQPRCVPADRPKDRFLKLDTLARLRYQLARYPDFYQLFAGVCVSGKSAAMLDPKILPARVYEYLNLKRPTIIIDASQTSPTANWKNIVALAGKLDTPVIIAANNNMPGSAKRAAKKHKVKIISPAKLTYLKKSKSSSKVAKYFILAGKFKNEDKLYRAYCKAFPKTSTRKFSKAPKVNADISLPDLPENCYLKLHNLDEELPAYLKRTGIFPHFKSIVLESEYLHNRDINALKNQRTEIESWLEKIRKTKAHPAWRIARKTDTVNLVVDLSDLQRHVGDITLYSTMPHYESGLRVLDDVLAKAKAMNITDAICYFKMPKRMRTINQRKEKKMLLAGLADFGKIARKHGITLHLRNAAIISSGRGLKKLGIKNSENLKPTDRLVLRGRPRTIRSAGGFVFTAQPTKSNQLLPMLKARKNFQTTIPSDCKIIFDANYLNPAELSADAKTIGRKIIFTKVKRKRKRD